jgi:glutathione S-transferase
MSRIEFDEIRIPLFSDDWREKIAQYSPAGRVPVLLHDGIAVWDSLAIFGYIRERHSDAVGWPDNSVARARARSIVAEMHSGFLSVRDELPQNIRARKSCDPEDLTENCLSEIRRINEIWSICRDEYRADGEWLFGPLSMADIMYAPVALRFVTYGIALEPPGDEFVRAVERLEPIGEWADLSRTEEEVMTNIDALYV